MNPLSQVGRARWPGLLVFLAVLAVAVHSHVRLLSANWPLELGRQHAWDTKPVNAWRFEQAYPEVRRHLPASGTVAYISISPEGRNLRRHLIFSQFSLAPLILVPEGGHITEQWTRLADVGPWLLFRPEAARAFESADVVLVEYWDGATEQDFRFEREGFDLAASLSGELEMRIYHRRGH